MKITTGGTTGGSTALAGYYHVASGLFDVVLAVASQRVGETLEAQLVLNTAVDPVYERWSGVGAITVAALQASRHFSRYGTTEEDLALISVKNYENARRNPYAHLMRMLTVEDAVNTRLVSWPLQAERLLSQLRRRLRHHLRLGGAGEADSRTARLGDGRGPDHGQLLDRRPPLV